VQETCIIIINVENSCAAVYFCRNHDVFFQEYLLTIMLLSLNYIIS